LSKSQILIAKIIKDMQTNTFQMKTVLIRLMTMVAGVMISSGSNRNGLNISKGKGF